MEIKPIKTDKDYNQALERLETIFDAKKGSPEGDELEVLGILIDQYENEITSLKRENEFKCLEIISLKKQMLMGSNKNQISINSLESVNFELQNSFQAHHKFLHVLI
jgi:HTH-type transcriptional regulator/antitoxin HigA